MNCQPRYPPPPDHVTLAPTRRQAVPPTLPASDGPCSWPVPLASLRSCVTVAAVRWRTLAFLADPPVVSGILLHLNLHHLPPPLSPARGPPQGDFLMDQTSPFDLAEPEPVLDFAFDQSLPADLDD